MPRKLWKKYNVPKKGMITKEELRMLLYQAPDPIPFEVFKVFIERASGREYTVVKVGEEEA